MCRSGRGNRDRRRAPDGCIRAHGAAPVLAVRRVVVVPDDVSAALADVVKRERLLVVASLIRVFGDWDLADDVFAEATERALRRWPVDGIPANPGAWLLDARVALTLKVVAGLPTAAVGR